MRRMNGRLGQYENNPTPEEIARECEAIQATWTPFEENKHRVGAYRNPPACIPTVRSRGDGSLEQSE